MVVQMASFLLISYLIIISSERNLAQHCIDIYSKNITLDFYSTNITLECHDYNIFKCTILVKYREILDKSCLNEKIFSFDRATCSSFKTGQYECPGKNYIGEYCNITNNICEMSTPCVNDGICYPKDEEPFYGCKCLPGYFGKDCKDDNRICKNNTCWHDGDCILVNETLSSFENITTFDCQCEHGYDGMHCELISNMCTNITCENNGFCFSSYLSWSCQCLDSTYGTYCENKRTALIVKQALSKSFASIAITAIISVFIFVITMDILKYGFNIDPVDRERRLMELEQRKNQFNKKRKKKTNKIPLKFYYIK